MPQPAINFMVKRAGAFNEVSYTLLYEIKFRKRGCSIDDNDNKLFLLTLWLNGY